ncbi:MAG: hypothetical protein KBS39_01190 [Lachnospiraceae bacterium]|nr:hypothetical protein [Candidatus Hippenecus merdae]
MESGLILEPKHMKKIIAKFFGVPESNVVKMQYSYIVKGVTGEQCEKIKELEEEK